MARVSGGPNRRRPRRHRYPNRVRSLLPMKPKKPASSFNLYVRDYFKSAMAHNFRTAPQAMKYAGQLWRNNANQRQNYTLRARPELDRFKVALKEYKAKKEVLKRPGNSFTFFLRDLWTREGRGKDIAELGKLAGVRWRAMSVAERQPFTDQAARAKATYSQMIDELTAGRQGLNDYVRTVAQNRTPPVAATVGA